jgi:site-specific DNA-methyltransferase (adenine-specific)
MTDLATNVPYCGDNLDIPRRCLPETCVDLVYLEPPFNSNRDDIVIGSVESGIANDARLLASEDTRHLPEGRQSTPRTNDVLMKTAKNSDD